MIFGGLFPDLNFDNDLLGIREFGIICSGIIFLLILNDQYF